VTHRAAVVPHATVRYYGSSDHCSDPQLGDLILVRHDSLPAKVIRFGESLRLHGEDKVFARVNHAMTCVETGATPKVQEMVGKGGVVTDLLTYVDLAYAVVSVTGATDDRRALAVENAMFFVGVEYGWPSIFGDSIYLLSGIPIGLTIGESVVCSADACSAQRALGLIPSKSDISVLPSDLAQWFDVRLPLPA
jgi:hypothetical protein